MEEQIQKLVFNPITGNITTLVIEVAVIWLIIKMIQRNLFRHFIITVSDIIVITKKLNNRPRKRLGFKTPNEVFAEKLDNFS